VSPPAEEVPAHDLDDLQAILGNLNLNEEVEDAPVCGLNDLEDILRDLGLGDDEAEATRDEVARSFMDHLVAWWSETAREVLRNAYAHHSGNLGKRRLQQRLSKEIGYRRRNRGRHLPEGAELGDDQAATTEKTMALSRVSPGLLIVPARSNKAVIGRTSYLGGNPPNPYQWAPVLRQHSEMGALIWEMGPGLSASASAVSDLLGRKVHLMALPAPCGLDSQHHRRFVQQRADVEAATPELVIVPLPLPVDTWSVCQHLRHLLLRLEPIWDFTTNGNLAEHPEFASTWDEFLTGIIGRLQTLDGLVREEGTKVCVSAPMVQGTPRAVEKAIHRDLSWRAAARWTVITEGGARHAWDGSPLVGEAMTVWEAS